MNFIENSGFDGYQNFLNHTSEIMGVLGVNLANPKKLHPLVCAALWYKHQSLRSTNTNDGQLFEIFLYFSSKLMPFKNESLNHFFETELNEHKNPVIALRPNDKLIGDFTNTQVPKGAQEDIDEFLSKNNVYIEFPEISSKKGIYFSSIYINGSGKNRNCYTGTANISSQLEQEVKSNSKVFTDNVSKLVSMILLFYISENTEHTLTTHLTREQFLAIKKPYKLKARLNKLSLFSKQILQPPKRGEGWRDETECRSWELTKEFEVRGHWRWQACGEKHSKRKLLWINPHVKGRGLEVV